MSEYSKVEPDCSTSIKILHIDDHTLFADGLAYVLSNSELACDVKTASNSQEVFAALEQSTEYDLLLIDLIMPDVDGLELIREINRRKILVPIAIMSACEDPWKIKQAVAMGVVGFLPKSMLAGELVAALQKIQQGDVVIPESVQQVLRQQQKKSSWGDLTRRLQTLSISPRQHEVLVQMQQGLSNRRIGEKLFVSESTVKSHVQVLFQALEARNRIDCLRKAESLGILPK